MLALKWPKNTSGRLPRTPPDAYFPAGNVVFTQETLLFQQSSVLSARSPKYALRKPFEGQLDHFLTPCEGMLASSGATSAWPVRPSALPPDSSGLPLAPLLLQLGYLNVNFALQEPCWLPSGRTIPPEGSQGPFRTPIFLQANWFSLRKQ